MNEITRIHLAKVPYDIEIVAKKQLETYLRALESYTDDRDWLQDIEIRITEILAERTVVANGLIATDDIAAIKTQLGEPEDFFGEGDIAVGVPRDVSDDSRRRLYRDPSTAVLGGVLSGIAQYFKIHPVWIRLAFIVLLFISFGTAAVVYVVLWLALPPATTAASQLELSGEPVTLASLKKQRQRMDGVGEGSKTSRTLQTILLYGAGVVSAVAAAGALVLTFWAGLGLGVGTSESSPIASFVPDSFVAWIVLVLFIASGLLLSALCTLIALVCFRKKISKSIGIAMIAIIVSGVITFGSGIGALTYQAWERTAQISASQQVKKGVLSENFDMVTHLRVGREGGTQSIAVEYVVSKDTPRYELVVNSETAAVKPEITVNEDGSASIIATHPAGVRHGFGYVQYPTIRLYGPALKELSVYGGTVTYTNYISQSPFAITAYDESVTVLGTYQAVSATVERGASIRLSDASIEALTATLHGGYIAAGVVRDFTVVQRDACPADDDSDDSRVAVRAVSSGSMTYNTVHQPAKTTVHPCGVVIVGDEAEYEARHEDAWSS